MTQDDPRGCTRLFTAGPAFGVVRIHLHIAFTSPQSAAARLHAEGGRNLYQGKSFWPLPANLTYWAGLMSCASGYAPGYLPAQSSVTWRADLTTISAVPDADITGIDDCDGAAARDYWREITLVRAFSTAFPHIPIDEGGTGIFLARKSHILCGTECRS
jgi:hypothetical protein